MDESDSRCRRHWIRSVLAAGLSFTALRAAGAVLPAARAATELPGTPPQSRGPFHPYDPQLEADADLVRVAGRDALARGVITHLSGMVRDSRGRPAPDTQVEIWQCDANGRYHHPRDRRNAPLDENFQGHGRTRTDAAGRYRFRTIRPVAYPGRAPHVHFAIAGRGFEPLITQMYVQGAPENAHDGLLNGIRNPARRASLVVPFEPHPDLPGEQTARFDVVPGADS